MQFDSPTSLDGTSVELLRNVFSGYTVSRVRVDADDRASTYDVPDDGVLDLGSARRSTRLRITVTGIDGKMGVDSSVGIVDVSIPDVTVTDPLMLAEAPTSSWLLAARLGSRTHCVPTVPAGPTTAARSGTVCDDALGVSGPDSSGLDRTLSLAAPPPSSDGRG